MSNPNRQVSFDNYADCVRNQIAFLISMGEQHKGASVSEKDMRECYERGVSVDGAAFIAR